MGLRSGRCGLVPTYVKLRGRIVLPLKLKGSDAMKISDLRDWASREFGAHSHKEGQVHAALGPLAESLDQLAKQGVSLEVVPLTELPVTTKPTPATEAPPEAPPATPATMGVEVQTPPTSPPLDSSGFVPDEPPPPVLEHSDEEDSL